MRNSRNWTAQEDTILMCHVKARPQNLHKCFLAVSERTGRTPGAVANHWYTKVSKDPTNLAFFTASSKHVSKNRKNGMGVETTPSIWRRLLNIIKNL